MAVGFSSQGDLVKAKRKKPRRKHAWERKLPSPPRSSEIVKSIILQHISLLEPRPVPLIHQYVLDDYGGVTDRTIYRHLKVLVKEGVIKRIQDDQEDLFGYVRASRPRWDISQLVYV